MHTLMSKITKKLKIQLNLKHHLQNMIAWSHIAKYALNCFSLIVHTHCFMMWPSFCVNSETKCNWSRESMVATELLHHFHN